MASSSVTRHRGLASSLPPRLLKFFSRYPPPTYSAKQVSVIAPVNASIAAPEPASSPDSESAQSTLQYPLNDYNPFQHQKHPVTGRWHNPKYSLRRQAEIVKLAREHGVEEMLPFTSKGTEERIRRREENGLRVKGTGVGQKVKGKKWERTLKGRLEARRQAMIEMPRMIQQWKQVSAVLVREIHAILTRCSLDMGRAGRSGQNSCMWLLSNGPVLRLADSILMESPVRVISLAYACRAGKPLWRLGCTIETENHIRHSNYTLVFAEIIMDIGAADNIALCTKSACAWH